MRITKREAEFKSNFGKELKRRYPAFYILLFSTRGGPDRIVIGNKRYSMWEFKHATPGFESPGDQELMCMRLNVAGYCRYVIFYENQDQHTLIVTPKAVHERKGWKLEPEHITAGFDIPWLVRHVAWVHGL